MSAQMNIESKLCSSLNKLSSAHQCLPFVNLVTCQCYSVSSV